MGNQSTTEKKMDATWNEFKIHASNDIAAGGGRIYRGQQNAAWNLSTSLHRTKLVSGLHEFKGYADVYLPLVKDQVEAWTGRTWDLATPLGLAEFISFLQHNGFPTPLLDWSYSPYIAAYFAFEAINHFNPQCEKVAIYAFNRSLWQKSYQQSHDFGDLTPHVSILTPRIVGNHKLAQQQGLFTWSNIPDIEGHIRQNEKDGLSFLTKYELSVRERPVVMRELSLMGITAIQLMPSVESVCKKALEDLIGMHSVHLPVNDDSHVVPAALEDDGAGASAVWRQESDDHTDKANE